MDETAGYIFSLLLGLFTVIRFKQLGEFTYKHDSNKSVPANEKWALYVVQTVILIVGI